MFGSIRKRTSEKIFLLKLVIVNVWIYTNHYSSNLQEWTHQLTASTDLNQDTQSNQELGVTLHSYHVQKSQSASGLLLYSHLPAIIECFSEDNLKDNFEILIPQSLSCLNHALPLSKCNLKNYDFTRHTVSARVTLLTRHAQVHVSWSYSFKVNNHSNNKIYKPRINLKRKTNLVEQQCMLLSPKYLCWEHELKLQKRKGKRRGMGYKLIIYKWSELTGPPKAVKPASCNSSNIPSPPIT